VGQFEPGSPISRLGREPDWQAMVIDHLKMNAGPATFGAQVQAARGLLGWTRARLSSECGLSALSLRRIEKGLTGSPYAKTRTAIFSAFEAAGIGVTIAGLPTLRSKKAAAWIGPANTTKFAVGDDVHFHPTAGGLIATFHSSYSTAPLSLREPETYVTVFVTI